MRGGVNLLQWHTGLGGDFTARLVLRRGLHHLAIEPAKLHSDLAKRCFDSGDFTTEFATIDGVAADAQRGGFAQDQFAKPVRIGLGTQHCEQHTGPVLFHLDRRVEHIERADPQCSLDEMTQVLGVDVV